MVKTCLPAVEIVDQPVPASARFVSPLAFAVGSEFMFEEEISINHGLNLLSAGILPIIREGMRSERVVPPIYMAAGLAPVILKSGLCRFVEV